MHAYLRRGLEVALLVGGGILFFAGQASADEGTTGADSALGGNQAAVSVVAPVAVTGSSISVVGDSDSSGARATTPATPEAPTAQVASTSGEDSAAGGNQVAAPVTAPVTAGGNAVSVLGDSSSSGSTATAPSGGSAGGAGDSTSGADSAAGATRSPPP